MRAPRASRRSKNIATQDSRAIPERTIEAALPRVAQDYAALIASTPKGEPTPDPKQVMAHYAAANTVLAHLLELSALAARKSDDSGATSGAVADAALIELRAGMAREKGG